MRNRKVTQRAAKGKVRINYPLSDHERRVIWWAASIFAIFAIGVVLALVTFALA